MPEETPIESRKSDHIRINLEEDVQSGLTTGLEKFRFVHEALPEINLADVDAHLDLMGKRLEVPILISSMTGGTPEAFEINARLAEAAEQAGMAMGVGSQRVALEKKETRTSFQIRRFAPTALVFANLGAVQLNYGLNVADCQRAVEMVEADGLILHLNPLQEALQAEGNTNFTGLLKKIEQVCRGLDVPVIVKEVGWGVCGATARRLVEAGVQVIDVAGAGGTSWSQVEMFRMEDVNRRKVAAGFRDWGIPTAEAILQVRQAAPEVKLFASGGLRDGIEIAKCVALGAELGGMAGGFLRAAVQSLDAVMALADVLKRQIQICMFASGATRLEELRDNGKLERVG